MLNALGGKGGGQGEIQIGIGIGRFVGQDSANVGKCQAAAYALSLTSNHQVKRHLPRAVA